MNKNLFSLIYNVDIISRFCRQKFVDILSTVSTFSAGIPHFDDEFNHNLEVIKNKKNYPTGILNLKII